MRFNIFFIHLVFGIWTMGHLSAQTPNTFLFKTTTQKADFAPTRTEDVIQVQNVTFSPELFSTQTQLKGQLFGETITIVRDDNKPSDDRNLIYGKIKEAKGLNYVLITRSNNTYAGNIAKDGKL